MEASPSKHDRFRLVVRSEGRSSMPNIVKGVLLVGLIGITPRAHAAPPAAPIPAACRSVPDQERYDWLAMNRQDIVAVQEVKSREPMVSSLVYVPPDRRAGARVLLTARPGETAEWIQRIAECHIARSTVRGYPQGGTSSALDVKGAAVRVSSTGDAFAVEITSTDVDAAREILRRVRALLVDSSAT
jgi:hypothetical protein